MSLAYIVYKYILYASFVLVASEYKFLGSLNLISRQFCGQHLYLLLHTMKKVLSVALTSRVLHTIIMGSTRKLAQSRNMINASTRLTVVAPEVQSMLSPMIPMMGNGNLHKLLAMISNIRVIKASCFDDIINLSVLLLVEPRLFLSCFIRQYVTPFRTMFTNIVKANNPIQT